MKETRKLGNKTCLIKMENMEETLKIMSIKSKLKENKKNVFKRRYFYF